MNTHSLFSYDFPKRSIIASATTLKKARNPQSAECKILLRMMSEHPDFEVAEKEINKKDGKQTYKGLTFGTMEDYIQTQTNSKKQLAVYQAVRRMSKIKGKEYALTKHWFLQSYPAYKEKAIAEQELHALLPKEEPSVVSLANAVYEILYFFAIKDIFCLSFSDLQE
jgi:phosphoribosylformylglycinamidine (FGAM) synthase-like enzyme